MAKLLIKLSFLQKLMDAGRLRVNQRGFSLSTQLNAEQIKIPNRIPRSSTDILQALASTVGRDKNGPHFKYVDDPFLIPASNTEKRVFSLAKENGRKAARLMQDKLSKCFNHLPEDPPIEAFHPKVTFTEESNVSEDTIRDLIQKNFVSDAIQVYEICKSKGVELSDDIRQALLEFLSYYNCEEVIHEDWIEERWYLNKGRQLGYKKTWKDDGVVKELYDSLSSKDSKAVCAYIRGMASYFQIDGAWKLYQEASDKGIMLDTNTHNSVIRISPYLSGNNETRWQHIQDLLKGMAENGVTPNLGTLNSTLEALVQAASWRHTKSLSLQVLSEFCNLGIEPSLATYYYLLVIHCREHGPISSILKSIMDHIEGKSFKIRDKKDTFFFVTAMDICSNHMQSLVIAHQVNNLLHTADNYCLIGDSWKESIYYRHFFSLACNLMAIENFMLFYNDYVPHVYTPEPSVMANIFRGIEVQNALKYVPQLWSDMIIFNHTFHERPVTGILSCMASHHPTEENEQLSKQFSVIAWDIWTRVQNQPERIVNKLTWSGQMMSNLLITLVQGQDYNRAVQIFGAILADPILVQGSVSFKLLRLMTNAAIDHEDSNTAVNVVLYAADTGHQEAAELAKEIASKLKLTSHQSSKLTLVLGIDLMTS